jgi:hypothetical protein
MANPTNEEIEVQKWRLREDLKLWKLEFHGAVEGFRILGQFFDIVAGRRTLRPFRDGEPIYHSYSSERGCRVTQ